jgi:hypothetical protein
MYRIKAKLMWTIPINDDEFEDDVSGKLFDDRVRSLAIFFGNGGFKHLLPCLGMCYLRKLNNPRFIDVIFSRQMVIGFFLRLDSAAERC